MKELSVEEKAKLYDKAIAYARLLLKTIGNATLGNLVLKNEFKNMFPTLGESEDEKMFRFTNNCMCFIPDEAFVNNGITKQDYLAWIEKQGEQKPVDKVGSKFNIGDIIIHKENGAISKVNNILSYDYELISFETGKHLILDQNVINGNSRLWTIQNAKDGDVLVCGEQLFLFKRMNTSNSFYAHCSYHFIGYDSLSVYDCSYSIDNVYPATKEQRDLLFQKMKEAGYEWDAEHKQLKKIEQKPIEWHREDEQNLNACLGYIPDEFLRRWLTDAIHVKYDKRDWSEEEESRMNNLCHFLDEYGNQYYGHLTLQGIISWLKSLRPQPRNEWSEEDEISIKELLYLVKTNYLSSVKPHDRLISFLESLKDRVQLQDRIDIEVWVTKNKQWILKLNGKVVRGQWGDEPQCIYKQFFYLSEIGSLKE